MVLSSMKVQMRVMQLFTLFQTSLVKETFFSSKSDKKIVIVNDNPVIHKLSFERTF